MESSEKNYNSGPVIIAEAGVNHNGSLEMALKMVDVAAECKVDYIKFQTFKSSKLVALHAPTADYQKFNCGEQTQFDMLRKLELSEKDFIEIKQYCKERQVGFLSTPFDEDSLYFLVELGMDYIKIPSGETTNLPFLRKIVTTKIPVIISTGMACISDIHKTLSVFYDGGYTKEDITLLHCNTQYPTPFLDVNLRAMVKMHDQLGIKTGYSDHTLGIEIPIAATAMGAAMIEKHFTLDRSLQGPDQISSLNPRELKLMVSSIRNVVKALGSSQKFITLSEKGNIPAARKSIVAKDFIKKGEIFCEKNLDVKRPGTGISPMLWDEIVGKTAKRDFKADELIEL